MLTNKPVPKFLNLARETILGHMKSNCYKNAFLKNKGPLKNIFNRKFQSVVSFLLYLKGYQKNPDKHFRIQAKNLCFGLLRI